MHLYSCVTDTVFIIIHDVFHTHIFSSSVEDTLLVILKYRLKKYYNILIGCVLLKKAEANSNCRANLDSLSLELAKRRLPRGFYACIKGADCLHKHGRAEV